MALTSITLTEDVRVYGMTVGCGSAARVTAGVTEGLCKVAMLGGVAPVDDFDAEQRAQYGGARSRTAIYIGPMTGIGVVGYGCHECQYAVVAPNSSWLPKAVVELSKRAIIASPSEWGANVLRRHVPDDRVCVYRHGVDAWLKPSAEHHEALERSYPERFRVLHMTSSAGQRKGTDELLQAWPQFAQRSACDEAELVLVTEGGAHRAEVGRMVRLHGASSWDGEVKVCGRLDAPSSELSSFYQGFHLICQPSRGEGFGLVPLEARACGIPVAMTDCTGHSEHYAVVLDDSGLPKAVAVVPTGPDESIDDGPGALAPGLEPSGVLEALLYAEEYWSELHEQAKDVSPLIHAEWSWEAVTKRWLEQERIHGSE